MGRDDISIYYILYFIDMYLSSMADALSGTFQNLGLQIVDSR